MKVFSSRTFFVFFILCAVIAAGFLSAEETEASALPDSPAAPYAYLGFTLEMLFGELGMPTSVHAVRGNEAWQDDVVFVYPSIEVYLFKDRVWQICPVSVYNMKIGDSIDQVKSMMGEPLVSTEQYLLYRLPSQAWPVMMRININEVGTAASFFIYRSDF
jgi:hypothetical protein